MIENTSMLDQMLDQKKAPLSVKEANKVPEAGLEPARPDGHKILSLACLPIPPLGQYFLK